MGQYVYHDLHNNAPAYKQRHSITDTYCRYLYKYDDGHWYVGWDLGVKQTWFCSNQPSTSVHDHGTVSWQFYAWKWNTDPKVTITNGPLPSCKTIRVVFNKTDDSTGDYVRTVESSRGHQVFKQIGTNRYLFVPKMSCWVIQKSQKTPSMWNGYVKSDASSWCPADPRAGWKDCEVKCDVHSF